MTEVVELNNRQIGICNKY